MCILPPKKLCQFLSKWWLITILSAVIREKLKGKAIHGRKKKMGNYEAALEYSGLSS